MRTNIFKSLALACALLLVYVANAQQYPGYTSYSIKNSTTAYLLDTNGTTYHTWTDLTGKKTGYSTYVMPGGYLWRGIAKTGNSFTGGPICGEVQKLDYNGNVVWDYVYSTTAYCTHHDICPMPNGNVLLIAYETKTSGEVAAAGCSTYSGTMWPDKIVEVMPTGATTGTVVWEWHAWDHLVQNTNASAANYQTSIVNHPELLNINYNAQKDWLHLNGVHYNPILDQITFSSHNLSEIYVIDHSTTTAEAATHSGGNSGKGGDILYRWGNPAAYGATGTKILNVVHDAHWVAEDCPNGGELMGYNNQGISTTASCTDIFNPPVAGYNYSITLGSAYLPSTYTLRQASGGYNSNEGGAQQLPNGNILISMGISGYIKEFSPTGTLLWSKTLTGANAKAFRYPECYINNAAPAIPTISESTGTLNSTSATTYQWYLNGQPIAGATNQSYTPTQSGIYLVRITDANGCVYQYSQGYNFAVPTGINELEELTFNIFPNPSSGIVNIQDTFSTGKRFDIFVYDALGKLVLQNKTVYQLDLSEYGNGMYTIAIQPENAKPIHTRVIISK
ncbi:MAG: aryl-sulfate sulfotransferase [Bacteroidia bacterium]|nr:aryl-sulfate sulfotransferase [Bacteroidia bacterium]